MEPARSPARRTGAMTPPAMDAAPARPYNPAIMAALSFIKMHGLGNDFVVLDARRDDWVLDPATVQRIADRHTGVGCDQLIVLEPPRSAAAQLFLRFFNADGSESGACGNGTRCAAGLVMEEAGAGALIVETASGLLRCALRIDGLVTVDMGPARLDWREIPLAGAANTLQVPLGVDGVGDAVCTGMGNPHATCFVDDLDAVDLARIGPAIETHPLFPEGVNVGVAQLAGPDLLRLKVWERGAGLTLACGTGACAAAVAASRRGLTGRRVEIEMALGRLSVDWREDGHVLLTGPIAISFAGSLDPALLAG